VNDHAFGFQPSQWVQRAKGNVPDPKVIPIPTESVVADSLDGITGFGGIADGHTPVQQLLDLLVHTQPRFVVARGHHKRLGLAQRQVASDQPPFTSWVLGFVVGVLALVVFGPE
jgi:hypothetical protein